MVKPLENNALNSLAKKVAKSDQKAYHKLFSQLWDPMCLYARSILDDAVIAEDVVQEVWIDYWHRRDQLTLQHIKSYLFKAVRFQCYKKLRDAKFTQVQLEMAEALPLPSAIELQADEDALYRSVQLSLSKLPKRCQEVFKLSRIHDFSNQQIAEQLNISQRSVENNISLALGRLRKELSIVKLF